MSDPLHKNHSVTPVAVYVVAWIYANRSGLKVFDDRADAVSLFRYLMKKRRVTKLNIWSM